MEGNAKGTWGSMGKGMAERTTEHARKATPEDVTAAQGKLEHRIDKLYPQPIHDAMSAIQKGLFDPVNGPKAIADALNKISDPTVRKEVLKAVQKDLHRTHAGIEIKDSDNQLLVYGKGASTGVMIAPDGSTKAVGIDHRADGPAISQDTVLAKPADVFAHIGNAAARHIASHQHGEQEKMFGHGKLDRNELNKKEPFER
jgi:hypothetical protein